MIADEHGIDPTGAESIGASRPDAVSGLSAHATCVTELGFLMLSANSERQSAYRSDESNAM